VSLAAATPCRLQLYAVLGSSTGNLAAKVVPAYAIKVYEGSAGTILILAYGERATGAN